MPGTMDTSSSRTVRLERRRNAPFGFSVRGGREHGTGLFVSHIEPGSSAQCHGLKVFLKLALFYIYAIYIVGNRYIGIYFFHLALNYI